MRWLASRLAGRGGGRLAGWPGWLANASQTRKWASARNVLRSLACQCRYGIASISVIIAAILVFIVARIMIIMAMIIILVAKIMIQGYNFNLHKQG